jgi:hypothetical protein
MNTRFKVVLPLLLLVLPVVVQAQFAYTTNQGAITITKYTGSGGAVTIPDATNGYPVTRIGRTAFYDLTCVTSVTIPNNVMNIEAYAFGYCYEMTNATIGKSVANIGDYAFSDCWRLTNVYFQGNAPTCGASLFYDDSATVFYMPGRTGWGGTFAGRPAVLWKPSVQTTNAITGVQTNQHEFSRSKRGLATNQEPHR